MRRRRLYRSVQHAIGPLEPMRNSVRAHPAAWAVGGALAGIVAARAFGAHILRGGKRMAGTWAQKRVGDALLQMALRGIEILRAEFEPPVLRPRDGHEPTQDADEAPPSSTPRPAGARAARVERPDGADSPPVAGP